MCRYAINDVIIEAARFRELRQHLGRAVVKAVELPSGGHVIQKTWADNLAKDISHFWETYK